MRTLSTLARSLRAPRRAFTASARQLEAAIPSASKSQQIPATLDETKPVEVNQAPNRVGVWSRSQQPRSKAMTGPRFEQTDFAEQVRPQSR